MVDRRTLLRSVGAAAALSGCLVEGRSCELAASTVSTEADPEGQFRMHQAGPAHTGYVPGTAGGDDGSELWRSTLGGSVAQHGLVADGDTVFVTGDALYALDGTDGPVDWCRSPSGRQTAPAVADGTVVVATNRVSVDEGGLYAYDRSDGTERWQTTAVGPSNAGPLQAQPTVFDGTVFVTGSFAEENPLFSAVDLATGDLEWQVERTGT